MKRFVGFVIAVAAIVALFAFKTFKIEEGEAAYIQYFREVEWWKKSIKEVIDALKSNVEGSKMSFAIMAVSIFFLPFCLLLAGVCKKFGRFFWGILALASCVLGVLVMNGVLLEEYDLFFSLFGNPKPFIGYYAAGGCAFILMIMPIAWRD